MKGMALGLDIFRRVSDDAECSHIYIIQIIGSTVPTQDLKQIYIHL